MPIKYEHKSALKMVLVILLMFSLVVFIHHWLVYTKFISAGYLNTLRDLLIPPSRQFSNTSMIFNVVCIAASLMCYLLGFILPKIMLRGKKNTSDLDKSFEDESMKLYQAKVVGSALSVSPSAISFFPLSFSQGLVSLGIAIITVFVIGVHLKINS